MDEPHQRVDLGGSSGSGSGLGALSNRLGALGGGLGAQPQSPAEIEITGDDFNTFERLLSEILMAYGREDLAALRSTITPEMLSYFSEELAEDASRGVRNEISDVKLLQGDLAESWAEGDVEYATVAMRYQITDRFVDRATGKTVEGGEEPTEATEVWTFRRSRGGNWLLSAIQQTE
jgi:predicted lipid-binding transport protein (Tim44 family)